MKTKFIFCICFLIIGCTIANAEPPEKNYNFELGLQTYYHEYEEPGIMENDGFFYGLSYSLSYEKKFYFGLEGLISYGEVDYTSASSGTQDDIEDVCFDTRGILGYVLFDDGKTKVLPYTGFAYRFLQDDSENMLTSTNQLGYLRESNYYYSPIGIRMTVNLNNGWRMHPEIEYDLFWSGKQESYLGYVSGYEDIENDQEDGYGYRLSLAFSKQFQNITYSFKAFYRYWDIDDSDITTDSWGRSWIEPDNETSEYGINVSIIF